MTGGKRCREYVNAPDILTAVRVVCGILLLTRSVFSVQYYLYCLAGGLSDALDGFIARKTGKTTEFGSKFDTAADIVFTAAVLIKLLKASVFPTWTLCWIAAVAVIKISNILICAVKRKRFAAVHSPLNRFCGPLLFMTALVIGRCPARTGILVFGCAAATAAALDECLRIIKGEGE